MAPRQPAIQRAKEYLQWVIAEHVRIGRKRLPTVSELASRAGVGAVAMSRAVRQLVDAGTLDARPGRGIHLPQEETPGPAPQGRVSRAEETAGALADAILNGEFPPGAPLPSVKELTHRFGVSYPSLRTALETLAGERIILRHRRGYRVADLVGQRRVNAVGLVASGVSPREYGHRFPRFAQLLRTIEEQSRRSNIDLLPMGPEPGPLPQSVLGYLILTMGMALQSVIDVYTRLAPMGKPVAILDDGTGVVLPSGAGRLVSLIRFADTRRDAETVATFLLQLGHRSIAYVSPTHGARWSQERLAGLRSVYEAAGLHNGVVAVTNDDVGSVRDALPADMPPEVAAAEAAEVLRRTGTRGTAMIADMLSRLRDRAELSMEAEILRSIEQRLFARAAAEPSVTAWVASSDYVASRALEFLQGAGVDVPGRVSLVGFDDSMEAFERRITSFNFNITAVVQTMFRHILNPLAIRATRTAGEPLHVDGFVTQRATTAKAPT